MQYGLGFKNCTGPRKQRGKWQNERKERNERTGKKAKDGKISQFKRTVKNHTRVSPCAPRNFMRTNKNIAAPFKFCRNTKKLVLLLPITAKKYPRLVGVF